MKPAARFKDPFRGACDDPNWVKEKWDDFRISKCYTNPWERVVLYALYDTSPADNSISKDIDRQMRSRIFASIEPLSHVPFSGGSYWTVTLDPPEWFKNYHLR
jgi:hypothetical protein